MDNHQLTLPGFDEVAPASALLSRHLTELGESWESTREIFALLGDRGLYTHNIQLRWPKEASKDVVLIVKVVTEEGPYVAFHSGATWTHLIPAFARRVRSGNINWIKDEFPPDNWVEILALLGSLPRIRR